MKLKLIDNPLENKEVTTFVFQPEQPLTWRAGQYMHYTLPHDRPDDRGEERYFTIASAPYEENVKITTRIVPELSSFKAALKRLPINATIEAEGPEGDFTVEDPTRHYVFIAGGIGITPVRAILLQLDHDGIDIHARLLYVNRHFFDQVFRRELDSLSRRHEDFTVDYLTGRIEADDIRSAIQDWGEPCYYLSGPEPMVEYYRTLLAEIGIPEDRIKTDDFPGYHEI